MEIGALFYPWIQKSLLKADKRRVVNDVDAETVATKTQTGYFESYRTV